MKAQVPLKRVTIEVEAETQKKLFAEIARAWEVFGEPYCGLCKSAEIKPVVRTVTQGKKAYDYYEYHCLKCDARLALGQNAEGQTLFPQRKLDAAGKVDRENGSYGPHRGWTKYRPKPEEQK